jgi:hypothetical protein
MLCLLSATKGQKTWAMLASLVETCKLHGVNPEAYLSDVLTKLVSNWPYSRLAELTPWAWPPTTADRHPRLKAAYQPPAILAETLRLHCYN